MRKNNGTMDINALAAKRAYMKEWRKNNPDKVKANQERYWKKKAIQMMEAETDAADANDRSGDGIHQGC